MCCLPATPSSPTRTARRSASCGGCPNRLPLSGNVVQRIAAQVEGLRFDRLYNNFGAVVPSDAKAVIRYLPTAMRPGCAGTRPPDLTISSSAHFAPGIYCAVDSAVGQGTGRAS